MAAAQPRRVREVGKPWNNPGPPAGWAAAARRDPPATFPRETVRENALGIEGGRDGAGHGEGTKAGAYPRCPRHPPGLGGTNRARGGEAAARAPPTPSRDTLPCFPSFSYFIPIFSRLLHHHVPTQALPKLSAPALIPTRRCFAPASPSIPTRKFWIKHLQAPLLPPLGHRQQPHDCSGCFFPC